MTYTKKYAKYKLFDLCSYLAKTHPFNIKTPTLFIFNFSFAQAMASRTNKQGIAKKKAQQQKQATRLRWAKRFDYPKRKITLEEAKELGVVGVARNPKWHEYNRFLRGRKVCRETRLRTDPDGFRFIKTPSGGSEIVNAPQSWWTRNKLRKNMSPH